MKVNIKPLYIQKSKKEIENLLKKENLLPFNREISIENTQKILDSVLTYGLLRDPIIVELLYDNNKHAIGDGQHLLKGVVSKMSENGSLQCVLVKCKTKKEVIDLIAKLNTTAKSWTKEDFLNAWLKFGQKNNPTYWLTYSHINSTMKESGMPLDTILKIFIIGNGGFQKGEPKMKNITRAENVYEFAKHFRSKYGSAAHQLAGVIKFAKKQKWDEEQTRIEFSDYLDYWAKQNNFPKDRDDMFNLLEENYSKYKQFEKIQI
tara:strand:+ start:1412 stop:2197 length:786 start_codon:yes stop_codon:yes gene_type:complete